MRKVTTMLAGLDLTLCLKCNGVSHRPWTLPLFRFVSWIGNGLLWALVPLLLAVLYGSASAVPILQMLVVATVGIPLYRWLKDRTGRLRPYQRHHRVVQHASVLDYFSFPSGHTQQAVAFTIVVVFHFPELGWFLVPVTALISLSRLVLGLHYPTDVLAGVGIGSAIAVAVLSLFP